MSDKEEPQVKPEEDIEKPLDAARKILNKEKLLPPIDEEKEAIAKADQEERITQEVKHVVLNWYENESPLVKE